MFLFHFLHSNIPDNKCHKQKWLVLFFTLIKLVVRLTNIPYKYSISRCIHKFVEKVISRFVFYKSICLKDFYREADNTESHIFFAGKRLVPGKPGLLSTVLWLKFHRAALVNSIQ